MAIRTSPEPQQSNDKTFILQPYQAKFIRSDKRYPAFVGAWATGKSLSGIGRCMKLAEAYPNNLIAIFRKEYTDLRDSTVKDFENYTGMKLNSKREVTLHNGSIIMFRHLEELNSIMNINLGAFWIEEASELDNDQIFFTLFGRLRRKDCFQTGFITANTKGHNWVFDLWKEGRLPDSELVEAKTLDNAKNLTPAYLASLDIIKVNKPEIYARFVDNSWDVDESNMIVIPYSLVTYAIDNRPIDHGILKRITVVDVAGEGDDETVILNMENTRIVTSDIYKHYDLMATVGRIQSHAKKSGSNLICVDKVGEGAGVYSRLCEIYQGDSSTLVYGFDGRISAPEGISFETYANYKTYAWFNARQKFSDRQITLPDDKILLGQLSGVTYTYKSNGRIALETKEKLKKKFKRSPDRADAYIMGLDALDQASPINSLYNHRVYVPQKGVGYMPERMLMQRGVYIPQKSGGYFGVN